VSTVLRPRRGILLRLNRVCNFPNYKLPFQGNGPDKFDPTPSVSTYTYRSGQVRPSPEKKKKRSFVPQKEKKKINYSLRSKLGNSKEKEKRNESYIR
jgi:hypothetical protein